MGHNGHARKMSNTSSRFWEDCVALAVPLASFRVTNDAIPEGALCHSRETHRPEDVASASGAPSRHVSNGHSLLAWGHEMGPGALWRPGGFSREPVGQEPQMQETACRVLISPWGSVSLPRPGLTSPRQSPRGPSDQPLSPLHSTLVPSRP